MRLGVLRLSFALALVISSLAAAGCALGAGDGDGADSVKADSTSGEASASPAAAAENQPTRAATANAPPALPPGTTATYADPDRPAPHPWLGGGGEGTPRIVTTDNPAPAETQAAK